MDWSFVQADLPGALARASLHGGLGSGALVTLSVCTGSMMQQVIFLDVIPATGTSGTSRPAQRSARRQEPQRTLPLNRLAAGTPAERTRQYRKTGARESVQRYPPVQFATQPIIPRIPVLEVLLSSFAEDAKVLGLSGPWPRSIMGDPGRPPLWASRGWFVVVVL